MSDTYSGSIAQVGTAYASALSSNKKSQLDLDVESFLQLIVAQIQNQDVLGMGDSGSSSSSSGDFVDQLLQMTLVQSLSNMMDMSMTSYAMGMVGKEVTVASLEGTEVVTDQGIVTGVSIYGDEPILHVNGKEYSLSQVMVVGSTEAKKDKTEALLEEILTELRKDDEEDDEDENTSVDGGVDDGGEGGGNPPTDGVTDTATDTTTDGGTDTSGGENA